MSKSIPLHPKYGVRELENLIGEYVYLFNITGHSMRFTKAGPVVEEW